MTIKSYLPGLALSLIVGIAATYVAETQNAPVMLMALLLGMVMHPIADNEQSRDGIGFAASVLLKIGVALLGLRITLAQIGSLGWLTALMVIAAVIGTILLGVVLARWLKLSPTFGIIAGGATAICGASAALAISSVLKGDRNKEAETILTVALVTSFSTLAMIFYPGLSVLFGFDDHQAGVLFGATIHDVAQVVGAGYAISDLAGDTATIVKLFRVVLLVPIVLCVGLFFGGRSEKVRGFPLPAFAVAFAILVVVNSVFNLPDMLVLPLDALSRWCLVTAVAALGMRTSVKQLASAGPKPLIVVFGSSLGLLCVVVFALWIGIL